MLSSLEGIPTVIHVMSSGFQTAMEFAKFLA